MYDRHNTNSVEREGELLNMVHGMETLWRRTEFHKRSLKRTESMRKQGPRIFHDVRAHW